MKDQCFFYREGDSVKQLALDTIVYFHAEGNYCKFYTLNKRIHYMIRVSIEDAMRLLPPLKFARLNRSDVVAIASIESFTRDTLSLREPKLEFNLSKIYYDQLLKKIVLLYTKSNKHPVKEDVVKSYEEYKQVVEKKRIKAKAEYQKRKAKKAEKRAKEKLDWKLPST